MTLYVLHGAFLLFGFTAGVCGAPVFRLSKRPLYSYDDLGRLTEERDNLLSEMPIIHAQDRDFTQQQDNQEAMNLQARELKLHFINNQLVAMKRHFSNRDQNLESNLAVHKKGHLPAKPQYLIPALASNSNQTYFYIVKSPRSGSTLLAKLLRSDSRVSILW